MQPVQNFPEANQTFTSPDGMTEAQVMKIRAYLGHVEDGSCRGKKLCITAWKPSAPELAALNAGQPVFVSFIGGMPPHFLTTNFNQASHPA